MHSSARLHKSKKGFTLIELLVVLVILGLLASLVGPQIMKNLGESKSKTAALQIQELATAVDLFKLDVGRYPTTSEGLQALVVSPSGLTTWNGPYLRKKVIRLDPWGYDYHYTSPGDNGEFDLFSYGADNSKGGEKENKDVVSWE